MPTASLIATLFEPPSPDGTELTALPDAVEWLEVRADRVGEVDPEWLRDHFKGQLLYSFRSENGGALNRSERLKTATRFYDRIELEVETDVSEDLLAVVPVEKRLI
jgi:3-dehydroquinate dehydratase/shikimate dehydrogenase